MQASLYTPASLHAIENLDKPLNRINTSRADQYEYSLVIKADTGMAQQLLAEKKAFTDSYKIDVNAPGEMHITVMKFQATEDMEPTISRWIQRICGQQESFIVTLNNYSGFPPNNIHVRVQYSQAFQTLGSQLKVIDNYVKSYGLPAARISNHPHLNLVHGIPEAMYRKAMLDYAQRDFHGSFIVNELVLLKQKHQFETARKITVFGLMPALATPALQEPIISF
jgi:2'-5' RNA ligase